MSLVKLTLLLFVLPWSFFIIESSLVTILLTCSWKNFQSGNYPKSQLCARTSSSLSRLVLWQTPYILGLGPVLNSWGYPPSVISQVVFRVSESLYWSSLTADQLTSLLSPILNSSTTTPDLDYTRIQLNLSRLTDSLTHLQTQLHHPDVKSSLKPHMLNPLKEYVSQTRLAATRLQVLFPDIPRFALSKEPATYLVLIHNPSILRPSGGIISQVVFVSLQAGRITHLEFRDPSNLDSQFLGQLTPPPEVQEHLGVSSWQTRNLAWNPDVSSSANQFFPLIDTALSRHITGVVFVNLDTVVKFLEIVGPISLEQPDLEVSAVNFYPLLASQAETPPSEAHFLFTVFQALATRLPSLTQSQSTRLLKTLFSSFIARQSFFVPGLSSSRVSQIGWDGKLAIPSCQSISCNLDYLYIVDSNTSGKVSDHQITKDFTIKTELSPEGIFTKLILEYKHTGSAEIYHNYLRLYLPFAKDIIQAPGNSTIRQLTSLNEISIPLSLSPGSESEITLAYFQKISGRPAFRYQLEIPNQPGSQANLAVELNYPSGWQTSSSLKPSFAYPGLVKYNKPLSQPFRISLDITTK